MKQSIYFQNDIAQKGVQAFYKCKTSWGKYAVTYFVERTGYTGEEYLARYQEYFFTIKQAQKFMASFN